MKLYMNRQLLVLMVNLGVKEDLVCKLVQTHLDTVKRCFVDNKAAITLLQSFNKIYYKVNHIV